MVYTDNIHLVADTLYELHEFAKSIGLHRCYYEGYSKGHPHYDLKNKKGKYLYDANNIRYIDKATMSGAYLVNHRFLLLVSQQSLPAKDRNDTDIKLRQLDRLLELDGYFKGSLPRKILEELTKLQTK